MIPNGRTDFVRLFEYRTAARIIGYNDGGNFAKVARNRSGTDTLSGIRERNRLMSYLIDVVHAAQLQRKCLVDFQNDLIRLVQKAVRRAHRRRRDHSVLSDSGTFHQGKVNM